MLPADFQIFDPFINTQIGRIYRISMAADNIEERKYVSEILFRAM